jgi:AbrB family looped-hinge helix DNA binding protein
MTTITIDEAGRIEIPADVRDQLGLHPRGTLQLEVSEGRIILQLADKPPQTHREGTALVVETPALGTLEDVNQIINGLREDRIQRQMSL